MASHEQVNATDLLNDVVIMEQNGLEKCWVSDHYMPWWHDGDMQVLHGLGFEQH